MGDSTFKVVYLVGLVVGSVIRAPYKWRNRKNNVEDKRETVLDMLLLCFAALGFLLPLFYIFTSWLDVADYRLPAWAGWVGTVVFIGALWLLWRSHADLGRNFWVTLRIREDHSLITEGVYRHIRHPMYAAHFLWGIAQALLLHNWLAGFSMLAALLPLFLVRIPREEQMLLDYFGEEYRSYMSRTGRIIPCLRR